ncbi:unnamed protein product [Meganyctiphanes norvegica]|uniref:BZIP domain-containing protein n=1 Tax=Meganyctiphanes norvegica TaxID=48144 RepID=A0AAV2QA33_MEGNR
MDQHSKYSLFGKDSETFSDILNTVKEIFPYQDNHLLTEQDTPHLGFRQTEVTHADISSAEDMCISLDGRTDCSASLQLLSDPIDTISPDNFGSTSVSMGTGALSKLPRSSQIIKFKMKNTKDDSFSNPDLNSRPFVSEYSQQLGKCNYDESYCESEIPVVKINENNQLSYFCETDFGFNENSLEIEIDNTPLNTMNNVTITVSIDAEAPSTSQESQRTIHLNSSNMSNANFESIIDSEDSISQASQKAEHSNYPIIDNKILDSRIDAETLSSLDFQHTENNDYSIMNNTSLDLSIDAETLAFQDFQKRENIDYSSTNNINFASNIEAEPSTSQESQQTERIDYSKLSQAEKYRRLRDLNNKASKRHRKRKTEKISEIANEISELEEKNRKLKIKWKQLESLRNNMLGYYNDTFNKHNRQHDVTLLKR